MKTLILHGVPYNVNDTNQVFLYTKLVAKNSSSSTEEVDSPQVGTYDSSTGSLILFDDWETRCAGFLEKYRVNLRAITEDALEKARVLQGVT